MLNDVQLRLAGMKYLTLIDVSLAYHNLTIDSCRFLHSVGSTLK